MSIDYTLGLWATIYVGGAVAALVVFAAVVLTSAGMMRDGEAWYLAIVAGMITALPVSLVGGITALAVSALLFPVVNLALQEQGLPSVIAAEAANGTVALRIITVLIAARALMFIWIPVFRTLRKPEREQSYLSASGVALLPDHIEPFWIVVGTAVQTGTLLLVAVLLWAFSIAHISDPTLTVLNWLLFFFVDDWLLLSDFLSVLKGRLAIMHSLRIIVVNVALCVLVSLLFHRTFGGQYSLPAAIVVGGLGLYNCGFALSAATRLQTLPDRQ